MGGDEEGSLRFRSDGRFKIVQFADLHFGEGEGAWWGPVQDFNSTRVMFNVLRYEKPDLVVFSGDQLTGNNIQNNATAYWKKVVWMCVELGFRWAIVFGNHDDAPYESNRQRPLSTTTRKQLMEYDRSFPLSFSQLGPENIHGVSNYYLSLLPSKTEKVNKNDFNAEIPARLIYFLDTGGGSYDEVIYPDQVVWLNTTVQQLKQKYNKTIPAVAFMHIPLIEFQGLYSPQQCIGMNDDGITPVESEGSILSVIRSANIGSLYVGHDHGNSWCCPFNQTLNLCYGRHTGYGGYGTWARGARVIELQESQTNVDTWIRMENGTIIDHEVLF